LSQIGPRGRCGKGRKKGPRDGKEGLWFGERRPGPLLGPKLGAFGITRSTCEQGEKESFDRLVGCRAAETIARHSRAGKKRRMRKMLNARIAKRREGSHIHVGQGESRCYRGFSRKLDLNCRPAKMFRGGPKALPGAGKITVALATSGGNRSAGTRTGLDEPAENLASPKGNRISIRAVRGALAPLRGNIGGTSRQKIVRTYTGERQGLCRAKKGEKRSVRHLTWRR